MNAYNKYYGWYYKDVEDMGVWIDRYHEANPDIPLAMSEYGAEGILAYHTDSPTKSDYTEEYHALYHQKSLEIFAERPFLWGTYLWNMFDFASDRRDEGGVKGKNNKGLVTHDHKTRKDAFYIYQAYWSKKPMLHIASKRYKKRHTPTMTVTVYSNQPSVTLFVNDEEIKTVASQNHVFQFEDIAMGDGDMRVRAVAGELSDQADFERVEHPEPSYEAPAGQDSIWGNVTNWFDAAQFEKEAPPFEFTEGHLSINETIKDILANEEGEALLRKTGRTDL